MPTKALDADLELDVKDVFSFLFNRKDRPFPEDKVIFQDADDLNRTYTWAQVRKNAITFGTGLQANYDFKKNDVVALFIPNEVDTPNIVFGTLWAGGVVSPANPGYTVDEFAYQLRDSGAKIVAVHFSAIDTAKAACKKVGISESNIIVVGNGRDPAKKLKHWTSVVNLAGTSRYRAAKIDPMNDLAFLVYSSGTTGKPKGVRLSHHNMTSNVQQTFITESPLSWNGSNTVPGIPDAPKPQGDKVLACLPFFHIYGLNTTIHAPLYSGVHVLVLAKFEIEKFCRLVQDHKVTFSYIVPPMVLLLAKHPAVAKYDLSSIRMTNSGAAPLTKELVEACFKRTGIRVKQGYGLSETSPTIFIGRWAEWNQAIGSTGKLVPNMMAKFCEISTDQESETEPPKELPEGETGELYAKGPNVFQGYHNNKAATAGCLDKDGWFRTGDVGYLDKEGNLWITDRVKELIKYKGFQVPPAELEGYLVDHPLVDDVAVVGVESKILGTEVPRAYVVRNGGLKAVQKGDDEKIIQWLNSKVASHKKLRGGLKFVDTIPKSVSGKLLRRMLRDEARKEFAALEDKQSKSKL